MNNSYFYPNFLLSVLFLFLILYSAHTASAQELNASVSIDQSQINSTSLSYLNNFSQQIETYINEYDWIDTNFESEEQIDLDIQITLLSVDKNYNFDAQLIIRSRRPIYNSIRETVLFFYNDENWIFNYTPNRGFIHDELQFDALTSVLDFYAYIVLGFDFDSFEALGGTPYFREAQNIVALAQTTSSTGWERTSGNRRNRAQLVTDLQNASYEGFRDAIYQYHRLGLDAFVNNPKQGREQVLKALQKIQKTKQNTSTNLLFDLFFNAKYRELVSIFEDASTKLRLDAFNILSDLDQSHLTEYRKLE